VCALVCACIARELLTCSLSPFSALATATARTSADFETNGGFLARSASRVCPPTGSGCKSMEVWNWPGRRQGRRVARLRFPCARTSPPSPTIVQGIMEGAGNRLTYRPPSRERRDGTAKVKRQSRQGARHRDGLDCLARTTRKGLESDRISACSVIPR